MIDYLDLVDHLLIAEAVTGIPAETLAKQPRSRRRLEGNSAISAHCSANLRTCPTAVDHFTPG